MTSPMLPGKLGKYEFSLLPEGSYFLGGRRLQCDGTVFLSYPATL